jgi:hypothetical protein
MKKYTALTYFILLFSVFCTVSRAQNNNMQLIPRQIFVGDPAILLIPLSASSQDTADIVLAAQSPDFPLHADIDFHTIILEQRSGESRLRVEFTAFVPGLLELPVIKIGEEHFSGITVTVSSIIDRHSPVALSKPASSLAMPGTALMLYGTMAGIIFVILLSIWFILKGRILIKLWIEKWKRRRLFASIKLTKKRLHKSVLKGENKRLILDKLSRQFRIFLSFLTGKNCQTMTAREFEKLSLELLQLNVSCSSFPGKFFQSCDKLRFSGTNINQADIFRLLTDLGNFIDTLEKTKKRKEEQAA